MFTKRFPYYIVDNCNRTLCNLNSVVLLYVEYPMSDCNRTLCNLNTLEVVSAVVHNDIVIVHYVI